MFRKINRAVFAKPCQQAKHKATQVREALITIPLKQAERNTRHFIQDNPGIIGAVGTIAGTIIGTPLGFPQLGPLIGGLSGSAGDAAVQDHHARSEKRQAEERLEAETKATQARLADEAARETKRIEAERKAAEDLLNATRRQVDEIKTQQVRAEENLNRQAPILDQLRELIAAGNLDQLPMQLGRDRLSDDMFAFLNRSYGEYARREDRVLLDQIFLTELERRVNSDRDVEYRSPGLRS